MKPYLLLAVSIALALDAAAQQSSIPQPGNPTARVPAVIYESAFERYTPWRDPKLAAWRDLNDEVGRVGRGAERAEKNLHASPQNGTRFPYE